MTQRSACERRAVAGGHRFRGVAARTGLRAEARPPTESSARKLSPNFRKLLASVDFAVAETQRQARRVLGRPESVRIVPYRGWVTPSKAVVLGRALVADLGLQARLERSPRLVRVAYERYGTVETPLVPVRVSWQGQTAAATSDAGGFIDVSFPLQGGPELGRTRAELSLASPASTSVGPTSVEAEVFGLDPSAAFGVISDIDDTVLETELTNPWKRALQLMYGRQRMRLPFDGIAALYQALAQRNNPVFYVSNAPWNLYAHVADLLDHHEIPKGPLLLRDSRFAERIAPAEPGGEALVHKQRALRRIVEEHPGLPFVLLGDSSRRDPLRYVEIAEAYPGRVAAIYIRRVHGMLARRASLDTLKERSRRAGVELLVADDTVSIAQHARSRGFVPAAEVSRVREGKARDEQSPPAELTSLASNTDERG
jgi:phosphatidate phosphatase APP1